jgi:hypothetical protein
MRSGTVARAIRKEEAMDLFAPPSARPIREHAGDAGLPVNEVIKVADTVIVRPDPQPAPAS